MKSENQINEFKKHRIGLINLGQYIFIAYIFLTLLIFIMKNISPIDKTQSKYTNIIIILIYIIILYY